MYRDGQLAFHSYENSFDNPTSKRSDLLITDDNGRSYILDVRITDRLVRSTFSALFGKGKGGSRLHCLPFGVPIMTM